MVPLNEVKERENLDVEPNKLCRNCIHYELTDENYYGKHWCRFFCCYVDEADSCVKYKKIIE